MSEKKNYDCNNCRYEGCCCHADLWFIYLDYDEISKYAHAKIFQLGNQKLEEATYIIASGPDGFCIYRDPQTGKCRIYNDRPKVCRNFDCEEEINKTKIEQQFKRYKELTKRISKYTGMVVAYLFESEKKKLFSSMIVKDLKTQKEIQLVPLQAEADTVEEVIEILHELLNEKLSEKSKNDD